MKTLSRRVATATRTRARRIRRTVARTLGGQGWTDADPDRLVWVNPVDIRWYLDIKKWHHPKLFPYQPEQGSDARRFVVENAGKVLDGDWDLVRVPFEDNMVYKLLADHFLQGKEWEECALYRQFGEEIDAKGRCSWRWAQSREDLRKGAAEVDDLYRRILNDGYLSAGRVGRHEKDEVTVCIGRSGELLYTNVGGHHRLSIAKILKLKSIPVRVLVRHEEWQQLRRRLRHDPAFPVLRSIASHPDLSDVRPRAGRESVATI